MTDPRLLEIRIQCSGDVFGTTSQEMTKELSWILHDLADNIDRLPQFEGHQLIPDSRGYAVGSIVFLDQTTHSGLVGEVLATDPRLRSKRIGPSISERAGPLVDDSSDVWDR